MYIVEKFNNTTQVWRVVSAHTQEIDAQRQENGLGLPEESTRISVKSQEELELLLNEMLINL